MPTGAKKTAYKLTETIKAMAAKHGVERLGFFTVTFPDPQPTPKEASARMNSLNTHVLNDRYLEWVAIYERGGKSKKPHFHLLIVTRHDIRTGCDFAAFERGDYSTAPQALRDEWAFWRHTTNYNGKRAHLAPYADIGRTELLPVKSTAEGIRKYVGKYVEKHMGARLPEDKGVRLLRMSRGLSKMTVRFTWHTPRSSLWRAKLATFAQSQGVSSYEGLADKLGSKWAYRSRSAILAAPIDWAPLNPVRKFATLRGAVDVDLETLEWEETGRLCREAVQNHGFSFSDAWNYYTAPEGSQEKRRFLAIMCDRSHALRCVSRGSGAK